MAPYKELFVGQVARALSEEIHRLTRSFPAPERFELTSQLLRAALSVPANLEEGRALYGPKNYLRHVRIGIGSLREVDILVQTSAERGYLSVDQYGDLTDRIRHVRIMLHRLARSLERAADQR